MRPPGRERTHYREVSSKRRLDDEVLEWPMLSGYQCAVCGEWNETMVDQAAGGRQTYVGDCQVCCRPNLLRVTYEADSSECIIHAELE